MVQAGSTLNPKSTLLIVILLSLTVLASTALSCTSETPTPTIQPTATTQPTNTPIPTESPTQTPIPADTPTPEPLPARPTPQPVTKIQPTPTQPPATPTISPPTATPTELPTQSTPTVEPTSTPIPPTVTPTVTVPTPTPTSQPQVTATPKTVGPPHTEPPPITGRKGGEIKVAVPQAPPHQDIHKSVSPILAAWGPGITYSRIFRYRWIAPDAPYQGTEALNGRYNPQIATSAHDIICDLCQSWDLSDDYVLTINLRSDAAWHTTNPGLDRNLNATDVAFSLNRLNDPTLPNSPLVNTISEIRATDDHTVEIQLTLPDAEIFDKLADARTAIVAPEAVNLNGDLTQGPTIGTGPWIQTLFERSAMRFEANRNYFIPELPLLDGITVAIIEDAQTRTTSLRTGQIDLIQPDVTDLTAAVERFDQLHWTRSHDPAAGIEVAFNTRRSELDLHNLRAAILYSWDPNSLIDNLHQGQSFISAGLPLNNPSWLLPAEEIDTYFNNRTKLLEILDGVNLPRGIALEIRVGQFGDDYIETAISLATAIKSLGFVATVEAISTRSFAEDVWINHDYDIYVGAPPPQSSATSTLFSIYHSAAPRNVTGHATKELDLLIEQQTTELNVSARHQLLLDIQREILRGADIFRAAANVSHWLWWSHLNNVGPSTHRADSFWLTRLWLSDRVRGG